MEERSEELRRRVEWNANNTVAFSSEGFGYAAWYISFASVASVVYKLRMKGYNSLPQAVLDRYGGVSMVFFVLALVYRLENEIWSNAMVVSSFFSSEVRVCQERNTRAGCEERRAKR